MFEHLKKLDLKPFDRSGLSQPWKVSIAEQHQLDADRAMYRRPKGRTYDDQHAIKAAKDSLDSLRLPEPGEDLHLWISAKYGSWALCVALLDRLAPVTVDELLIATLSFSKSNATSIIERLEAKTILDFGMIVSHYFRASNREIYDTLAPYLDSHKIPIVAMRNHAKVITITTSDQQCFTIQGSANLRSNKNIEQVIITNDLPTCEFHSNVIRSILAKGSDAEIVESK